MKLAQKTIQSLAGPVVIHWITLDLKKLIQKEISIFPVIANVPNTLKKMEQIAAAFRRIKNVSLNGIRGEETNDTVLIISRNKGVPNIWKPLSIRGKTILSFDAIEFIVITNLVQEKRLWMHKGYRRWFEVAPVKDECERQIVMQVSNQRRLYYSIPRTATPFKFSEEFKENQLALYNDGWFPVIPTLMPIGYTNSFATLPELCETAKANAGINAGYFLNMPEELDSIHGVMNDPVGFLMIDGTILIPPTFTRSCLLINTRGEVFIHRVSMKDIEIKINNCNIRSATIYTRTYGTTTPNDANKTELVITEQEVVELNEEPGTTIPQNGFVLSYDKNSPELDQILAGLSVSRKVEYTLKLPRRFGTMLHGIAAGPQLVDQGRLIPAYFFEQEPPREEFRAKLWAPTRFTHTVTDEKSRAPRSAIGITTKHQLILLTVDDDRNIERPGNKRYSIGATLRELAEIMLDLDCYAALNFDGGGSSTLWYNGEVVNRPSDGFPRVISTAVVVKK
ncbi:MAG: phosphodiester glycosidase family protein [bacterium]|nr:phosphodiester glycosidase family protein [bacterium]